jgi:hypothetical protein
MFCSALGQELRYNWEIDVWMFLVQTRAATRLAGSTGVLLCLWALYSFCDVQKHVLANLEGLLANLKGRIKSQKNQRMDIAQST